MRLLDLEESQRTLYPRPGAWTLFSCSEKIQGSRLHFKDITPAAFSSQIGKD